MISNREKRAVLRVIAIAKNHGYGNLIAHLKTQWAKQLVESGLSEESAMLATDVSAYPLSLDILGNIDCV